MTDPLDRLRQQIADLRAEIERLDSADAAFESMLGELDHRARRVRDGLERAGWRSRCWAWAGRRPPGEAAPAEGSQRPSSSAPEAFIPRESAQPSSQLLSISIEPE